MVLISGRPKANVLWDAVNIAAMVSFRLNPKNGSEKVLNKTPNETKCMTGINVNKAKVCLRLRPRPVLKELQKAFQTIPNRMIYEKANSNN